MKKSLLTLRAVFLMTLVALSFTACVKKEYDEPEVSNLDPNLTVTHTIADLRATATFTPTLMDTNTIIAGIVTADDESGAFYKEMIIQDSTGGLSIQLDVSNYNTNYPIGRRVFVKCTGLSIAKDSDGNVEIGAATNGQIGRIPAGLVQQYLVPGKWGLDLPFVDASLDYINANVEDFCQLLVRMPSVEFANADANQAWAGDPLTSSDNNRELKDCTGNSLIVYTSAYASFANARTPFRNGQISGIMKIYRGDGELIIRDLSDVNMNDLRCDGSSGNPVYIPLDSVRLLDPGSTPTALPGDKFIRVIVTSDNTTNMINGQNLYCQDQTAGIQIRFSGTHSFALGTQLEINVSGQELSNYRGVLQINNVPLTSATVIAPPTFSITPRVATLADLNTNYDQWEGQLVKVNAVTLTGATTYAGSLTMDDGTGTMILYTSTSATFSGSTVPTGPVNVTGLLIEYNGTKEIIIRNISDVQ